VLQHSADRRVPRRCATAAAMAFILFEAVPFVAVCLAHQALCLLLLILRPLVFRPVYGYARSWTVRFLFGAKLQWAPDSQPLAVATPERPIVYCCNHRSWADNGIDGEITGAPYTSRMLVAAAFPFTAIIALIDGGIIFFKRGKTTPEEFNEKCSALLKGHTSSMLGYPEGTRHTEDAPSRPLKTGMLRMSARMGVCIQLVITAGKGEILQEKRLRFRYGKAVTTFCSKVFDPKTMSEDEFVSAIQEAWGPTYKGAVAAQEKFDRWHGKK
jgi:1-acyl-sn-glycerol-3-phosphate acyltransferase